MVSCSQNQMELQNHKVPLLSINLNIGSPYNGSLNNGSLNSGRPNSGSLNSGSLIWGNLIGGSLSGGNLDGVQDFTTPMLTKRAKEPSSLESF